MSEARLTPLTALRDHWPEYLIEAWALGMFMVSAGVFTTLIEQPSLPIRSLVENPDVRRSMIGLAMGLTAIALIYSPWGKRSGAHMNPAVTLSFLRANKMHGWDAVYYILFQVLGGVSGVLLVRLVFGDLFSEPPVNHVVTVPGEPGVLVAMGAEFVMSMLLMFAILAVSNSARLEHLTGVAAGILVATFIAVEAPLSGMSINPARTVASAWPAGVWTAWWIYFLAPIAGMLAGVQLFHACWPRKIISRAKLAWSDKQRCIHSGYKPPAQQGKSEVTDG
jgi:aquaporin Z